MDAFVVEKKVIGLKIVVVLLAEMIVDPLIEVGEDLQEEEDLHLIQDLLAEDQTHHVEVDLLHVEADLHHAENQDLLAEVDHHHVEADLHLVEADLHHAETLGLLEEHLHHAEILDLQKDHLLQEKDLEIVLIAHLMQKD